MYMMMNYAVIDVCRNVTNSKCKLYFISGCVVRTAFIPVSNGIIIILNIKILRTYVRRYIQYIRAALLLVVSSCMFSLLCIPYIGELRLFIAIRSVNISSIRNEYFLHITVNFETNLHIYLADCDLPLIHVYLHNRHIQIKF